MVLCKNLLAAIVINSKVLKIEDHFFSSVKKTIPACFFILESSTLQFASLHCIKEMVKKTHLI